MSTLERPTLERIRRPENRLRAGRFMQILAYASVAIAIAGAAVAWRLVGQADDTVAESLELTASTLVTLEQTVTLADEVIGTVDDALLAAERSLRAVVTTSAEATEVITTVDALIATAGPSIRDAETTLRDLAVVGGTIDDVLEQLDDLPFGPDYDAGRGLGTQLDLLADDLAPVAASFEDTSDSLGGFVTAGDELVIEVVRLADAVGAVNDDLRDSEVLFDAYQAQTRQAQVLAARASADLDSDITAMRALIILGGLLLALGQLVPWWVGRELTISAREAMARERADDRVTGDRHLDLSVQGSR